MAVYTGDGPRDPPSQIEGQSTSHADRHLAQRMPQEWLSRSRLAVLSKRTIEHHRYARMIEDMLGDTAQQDTGQTRPAVSRHDH
jgi:hypothetical protein